MTTLVHDASGGVASAATAPTGWPTLALRHAVWFSMPNNETITSKPICDTSG